MKKICLILTALWAVSYVHATPPTTAAPEKGEHLFKRSCATCHGKQGEKKAFNQSAVINQLTREQIIGALQERKDGHIQGAGNTAKERLSEQDMKDLAEFLQSLK